MLWSWYLVVTGVPLGVILMQLMLHIPYSNGYKRNLPMLLLCTPAYTPTDRLTSWGVLYHPYTVPVYKLLFIRQ
jgi:hypothetical protein